MPKVVNKTKETSNMVRHLSGLGIPQEQICSILNISKPSLYKYYGDEIINGKAHANAKVAECLFNIATGNSNRAVVACMFWLKTQCNWTEKQVLEVADATENTDKFRELARAIQRTRLTDPEGNDTIN